MGSLFSGIGGLELGLEAAGFGPVAWQVEIDGFCRKVLAKHWPDANRSVSDVCAASAATLAPVDLICGGFPCVETSSAGSRKGMDGDVSGPLWKQYLRILGELRPRLAVVENVAGGKKRWLCQVRTDLHQLGYDTAALAVSAEDVGAPHRRARIFVVAVAHAHGERQPQPGGPLAHVGRWAGDSRSSVADADGFDARRLPLRAKSAQPGLVFSGSVADTTSKRRSKGRTEPAGRQGRFDAFVSSSALGDADSSRLEGRSLRNDGRADEWPLGSSVGPRDDGAGRVLEPGVGRAVDGLPRRVDGHRWPTQRGEAQAPHEAPRTIPRGSIHNRARRLKALGNAVVPQCAYVVGQWIREVLL